MNTQSQQTPLKVIIVGGVAGGMSAAARLRRLDENASITVFERSGYVSFANCGLPYYLGREIPERENLLLQTPDSLNAKLNIDVRVSHEVLSIDPDQRAVTVLNRLTGQTFEETFDELLLSVGANPIRPSQIQGIDTPGVFTLRNIEDTDAIDGWIQQHNPTRVVVTGGGFIGLEVAEQLKERGMSVTLVDNSPQLLRPFDPEMAIRIQQTMEAQGIHVLLNSPLQAIQPPDAFETSDSQSTPRAGWIQAGEHNPLLPADLVIMGLGVRPEVKLAEMAGIALGERKGIRVNETLQTSHPNIWAVGDAIEVTHPVNNQSVMIALGGPANRQGRMVADNMVARRTGKPLKPYPGTWGTAIIRVFDLTAAATGLNELQLRQAGVPYEAVHLYPKQHAGYFPGAESIALKVLFHPETGKLYGAQAVGKDGVDKRMDVLATAMQAGLSVTDLAQLELSYAPPYGSAKDPVNMVGMMAENILEGLMPQTQWHQVLAMSTAEQANTTFLDVRDSDERAASQGKLGPLDKSIHIPLCQLRNRLNELPKDTPVVVFCQSGQRSYLATRILLQSGYSVKNLAGASLTFQKALALNGPAQNTMMDAGQKQLQPA